MLNLQKRHTTVLLLALAVGLIMVDASVQGACLGNAIVNIGSITSNLSLAVFGLRRGPRCYHLAPGGRVASR